MEYSIPFGVFDPEAELDVTARNLPHWFQPGVAMFITFRTDDSMPKEVVESWRHALCHWLRERGVQAESEVPPKDLSMLPSAIQLEFKKYRDQLWHGNLDACYGTCVLRRREIAEIALQSFRHFDGDRYHLDCAIVMPNHVHLLVQFIPPTHCRAQCDSWLHFTAHEINRHLSRRGAFWQSEPFDHLVRSAEQFEYLRKYIARNGIAAGLPDTDYLYWRSPVWHDAPPS